MSKNHYEKTGHWLIAVWMILLLLLPLSIFYSSEKTAHMLHSVPFDMSFFIDHGKKFWQTGKMFERAATPEQLQYIYAPSGCCSWKYPPIGEALLIPYTKYDTVKFSRALPELGITIPATEAYLGMRLMSLAAYALGAILLIRKILQWRLAEANMHQRLVFLLFSTIVFLSADPIFFLLDSLNYETLMFLMVVLATLSANRRPALAGFILGCATAIKLYPSVLIIYFIATRSIRGTAAFFFSFLALTALGFAIFGIEENIFFWQKVFPIMLNENPAGVDFNLSTAGIIKNMAGLEYLPLFTALKFFVVFYCGYFIYQNRKREAMINMSVAIIAMILFLKNYWSAYQIYLLIPLCLVAADSIRENSAARLAIVSTLAVFLFVDFNWLEGNMLIRVETFHLWKSDAPTTEVIIKITWFLNQLFTNWLPRLFLFKSLIPWVLLYCLASSANRLASRTAP